jgi:hypothetical protein
MVQDKVICHQRKTITNHHPLAKEAKSKDKYQLATTQGATVPTVSHYFQHY